MDTYPVVDHREEGPWSPSYELGCTCELCGEQHIAIFTKGQKPDLSGECPHCEVRGRLQYHYSRMARDLRAKNAQTLAERSVMLALPPGSVKIYDNHGGQ